MIYDTQFPAAVFLGPSLPVETARTILPANYYPPVRMGNVYRLLAAGLETLVIIDGVFHATTPVWQREILAALDAGVRVVGGGSMGALRAAELDVYGMEGCGEIYGWYRDGVIDGDDEVALLHADAESGYLALSDPLVNVRFNLARARRAGLIDEVEDRALVAHLKGQCFTTRTYRALRTAPAWHSLGEDRAAALAAFLQEGREDLKRRDAEHTLRVAAGPPPSKPVRTSSERAPRPEAVGAVSTLGPVELMHRGILGADGVLQPVEDFLRSVAGSAEVCDSYAQATEAFYLLDWASRRGVKPPEEVLDAARASALADLPGGAYQPWGKRSGMLESEFQSMVERRATVEWLLGGDPAEHGVEWEDLRQCLRGVLALDGIAEPSPEIVRQARATAFLAAWADEVGVVVPDEVAGSYVESWLESRRPESLDTLLKRMDLDLLRFRRGWSVRALFFWLLDQGPRHFGFQAWSPDAETFRWLQIDGGLRTLLGRNAAPGA